MKRTIYHLTIGTALLALVATSLPASPVRAQDAPPQPGICEGVVCGPSGELSPASFPTLAAIDWDAFPANTSRWDYAPGANGREIWVALDGDDGSEGTPGAPLATPGRALELAQPGDVIWVRDGTYALGTEDDYEALILTTPGITLAAEHIGGVTFMPGAGDMPAIAINASADDLVIDGFILQGFRSAGIVYGRAESPQRNLALKHLRIERTEEAILSTYEGDGSQPVIAGMLVYDVWLRDIGLIGLQCGQGPCNDMRWEALRIEMPPSAAGDSGQDGMAVESGENVVVFNVEVTGGAGDGIDLKAGRAAVANVIVHDVGRNGVKLWAGGDVINALVYNTGADAAIVFEAGHYRVLNTIVARHAWGDSAYAMTAAYDSPTEPGSVTILNSVFYQNAGAVWISPALALDVQHSLFAGSGNGEEIIWEPLLVGEGHQPISALEDAGGGANNLGFVDPLFANPDAGDYAWGEDSPLLDAGASPADVIPPFDLFGRARVYGPAIDLGPWEWQPPSTVP